MITCGMTNHKGNFVKIPKSVRKFMNKRIEHYFEDDKYGHDFIEELVNLDLIQKYGYDSFRIFVL